MSKNRTLISLPEDVQQALNLAEQQMEDKQTAAFLKFWCSEIYQWYSFYLHKTTKLENKT